MFRLIYGSSGSTTGLAPRASREPLEIREHGFKGGYRHLILEVEAAALEIL